MLLFLRATRRLLAAAILLTMPMQYVVAAGESGVIYLATTTSTENSGLLKYIIPQWQSDTGLEIRTVAVGTGKALKLGMAGDVDIVMVHARQAELDFIEQGYGVDRTEIMYNDFVVVGPINDALDLSNSISAIDAFSVMAEAEVLFFSRGDDSGTHKKETSLWSMANVVPNGNWYREVGQGMGKTLQITAELGGYTMTDRGTWLSLGDQLPLKIVYQGDPPLFNQYSIMAVNPERHSVNYKGAKKLIGWISSEKGQTMIAEYQINGTKLFAPNAIQN